MIIVTRASPPNVFIGDPGFVSSGFPPDSSGVVFPDVPGVERMELSDAGVEYIAFDRRARGDSSVYDVH